MSVSLRATGTWAELTADGPVTIPPTPQAGDRMFLYGRWKDFSVTATVANWTELIEFADGAVAAGNGTGSVKVGCWYRDWQPGDSDPTIDFSAAPENASVVITVMQKGADDVWDTPVARTAAMTNWTTTSQSVSASATVDVRSGGVVMGLIGIRDDTATMTRPANGIDDDAAAVMWNGNYVESPATHHSTTTGFDGAADLGYRLVTTGATATLRMTGTISAAETGAALWVVQGVNTLVTPATASLISSQFAPLLKLLITPAAIALTVTSFAPQLREVITPTPATLSTTTFAPSLQTRITPATATLTITTFAPQLHETLIPATATVSLTTFTPTLQTGVTPGVATLTLTTFAPLVTQNLLIEIPTANLTITTSRPHVKPFKFTFLDPGGDAVHAPDYFHKHVGGSGADITYDPTVQVAGVGSYRFDSNTNEDPTAEIPDVLGAAGRVSFYWRADSVPDKIETAARFADTGGENYSGGGFEPEGGGGLGAELGVGDDNYGFATPARNSGQGNAFPMSPDIPVGAVIDLVKIIYERKYDTVDSTGISRVKYRIDGVEGPNHDNTDEPLTDTVVEVDVTGDRAWGWEDFLLSTFEVIAEARRGDTDTPHTQSWDYVKVEVEYHLATAIMAPPKAGGGFGFQIAITPKGAYSVVRFVDGAGVGYDGITRLLTNTQNRISFSYVVHDTDDLDIKVYVNQIEELSIEEASTGGVTLSSDLHYGWLITPGVDHRAWFSHLAIDEGDDLTDIGNVLSTAKRSAALNEDNWNTVGGTGAVNERPLSETNYVEELEGIARLRQSYTLEEIDEGDVDLTGESLIGYMGWAWARVTGTGEPVDLILNNVLVDRTAAITGTSPLLLTAAVTDTSYPSHAAGIGMRNAPELLNTFMYEGGAVLAYLGPSNPDILLERQLVDNETLDTIVDDLRSESITSYELCCTYDDFDGSVRIVIHSLDQDGGSIQKQAGLDAKGRVRIVPGVEVYLDVTVIGVTTLQIWRRLNVD